MEKDTPSLFVTASELRAWRTGLERGKQTAQDLFLPIFVIGSVFGAAVTFFACM